MNIVVLCGGISTERAISIVSGTGVCKALRSKGHRAILLDVFGGDPTLNLSEAFPDTYDVDAAAENIHAFDARLEEMKQDTGRAFFGENVLSVCGKCDMVFLALHGENGENGKVQAAFDLFRIRYTGTGHLGSAITMDKGITKIMLEAGHIPTPHGVMLRKESYLPNLEAYTMKFPVVVKPCNGGSSVGVSIVNNREEYGTALKTAFDLEDEIVVEDYIKGREFSVSVIDGQALPVIEIAPLKGFYDYQNKYTAGSAIETCPANIPHRVAARMQQYSEEGYRILALDAYARFDFLMNENGDLYCLEGNTLPGMTPTSLMPQEAVQTGMDYPTLCEELIRVSLKKYAEKN